MALPVSRLVRVSVNLSPTAAAARSFGVLLIAGDSNVINAVERVRTYSAIEDVAGDFGTSAPEYLAAALYFGQTPKPKTLMIGRWLRTAASAINIGGILSASQQALSNFTAIVNGGVVIVIDGVTKTLTGLNFSAQTNLNGVATVITTALGGAGVCSWDGESFRVTSSTTGVSSTVGYATVGTGTDISALLQLNAALSLGLIPGFAAETALQAATAFVDKSALWYGLMFAAATQPVDDQFVAIAGFIEALDLKRVFGVTNVNTNTLSSAVTTDISSRLMALAYRQSFSQYSSKNPYAVASFFGRAFSVNFNANRSTITLMYKQEPGVLAEDLSNSQADVLKAKRANVFVAYVNSTMIIQYGTMAGPAYFDEIHGLDWLQDLIQTSCFNVLYTTTSKVPQTDAGANQLTNAISGACEAAVNNGLVAPGVWNADGFGELQTGQYLKTGYYIYAQPMALQSQADRETRVAPPFQVAVKLAGAIQELDVLVNVNR